LKYHGEINFLYPTMTRPSYAFTLAGIEPKDNTFKDAGEDVHRSFWQFIVQVGIEVKTRSLLQGLGALTARHYAGWLRTRSSTRSRQWVQPKLVPRR
jgi:hypothetical protein